MGRSNIANVEMVMSQTTIDLINKPRRAMPQFSVLFIWTIKHPWLVLIIFLWVLTPFSITNGKKEEKVQDKCDMVNTYHKC